MQNPERSKNCTIHETNDQALVNIQNRNQSMPAISIHNTFCRVNEIFLYLGNGNMFCDNADEFCFKINYF
jgi:hypothetical protein